MKRLPARSIYMIYSAASALFFAIIFTVNLVYQATIVNLNPLQLVLVGTLLETTVFLFEIPTGVVADAYSRRLSVIIGVALIGAGFIVEGSFPYFAAVMAGQVLWGLGVTFTSGAAEAWIADEVGEAQAGLLFLRGAQAGTIGGIAGALVSVALGSIRVNIPIITGGGLFLTLALYLTRFMPEHRFTPKVRDDVLGSVSPLVGAWSHMWVIFVDGLRLVRRRRALVTILLVGLFLGLYSEGFDRLWTPHLLRDIGLPAIEGFKPVVWFGAINVVMLSLSLASMEVARRRLSPDDPRLSTYMLAANSLAIVAGLVVFALAPSFPLATGAYLVIAMARGLNGPYLTAWVNRYLTPDVRATVLSMTGQVDSLGQIAGGPILGAIGNVVSIRAALLGSALLLSPVLALFARELRQAEGNPQMAQIDAEKE